MTANGRRAQKARVFHSASVGVHAWNAMSSPLPDSRLLIPLLGLECSLCSCQLLCTVTYDADCWCSITGPVTTTAACSAITVGRCCSTMGLTHARCHVLAALSCLVQQCMVSGRSIRPFVAVPWLYVQASSRSTCRSERVPYAHVSYPPTCLPPVSRCCMCVVQLTTCDAAATGTQGAVWKLRVGCSEDWLCSSQPVRTCAQTPYN